MIKKILIVCSGNSCRSPMAEAFLKKYLRPEDGYEVISAGTLPSDGFPPTREAIEVMGEEDIDISSHLSKSLSEEIIESADLILVMSEIHKRYIQEGFPKAKDKVYLFKELAGIDDIDKDIHDPIGGTLDMYRKIKDEIKRASFDIARKIKGVL